MISRFAQSIYNSLWSLKLSKNIEYVYDDVIDLKVPFAEIGVNKGEYTEFCVITAKGGIIDEIFPQDMVLKINNN